MKITKNIGMLLLAVYLIIDGLLGFGLNLGPAIFLLYLVALAAGIFILIGKISWRLRGRGFADCLEVQRRRNTEKVDRLVPKPMTRARQTRSGQRVPPYFKYLSNHATVCSSRST